MYIFAFSTLVIWVTSIVIFVVASCKYSEELEIASGLGALRFRADGNKCAGYQGHEERGLQAQGKWMLTMKITSIIFTVSSIVGLYLLVISH